MLVFFPFFFFFVLFKLGCLGPEVGRSLSPLVVNLLGFFTFYMGISCLDLNFVCHMKWFFAFSESGNSLATWGPLSHTLAIDIVIGHDLARE